MSDSGIVVSAAVVMTDDHTEVAVSVLNGSGHRIDVMPDDVSLDETAPQPRVLHHKRATEIAKSIKHGAAWNAAFTHLGGAFQTQTTTTSTTSTSTEHTSSSGGYTTTHGSGTSTSSTTSPDEAARIQADAKADWIVQTAAEVAADVIQASLKANTLMPGEKTAGISYFDRDKHAEGWLFSITIGAVKYVFPLERSE
jgi:hypothetical protein